LDNVSHRKGGRGGGGNFDPYIEIKEGGKRKTHLGEFLIEEKEGKRRGLSPFLFSIWVSWGKNSA